MAFFPMRKKDDPLKGLFKSKDFSQAVTANQWKLVDIGISGYTLISVSPTGGNAHKNTPMISGNSLYVICDASVTITWRVIYIKNGILNN